mmetsp:Transcript_139625/g.446777  ORF Transcript_139625/g.446777 Transcript_139625/m.446777 type:complete len:117 (+) Transcript_139625:248-598(+)
MWPQVVTSVKAKTAATTLVQPPAAAKEVGTLNKMPADIRASATMSAQLLPGVPPIPPVLPSDLTKLPVKKLTPSRTVQRLQLPWPLLLKQQCLSQKHSSECGRKIGRVPATVQRHA